MARKKQVKTPDKCLEEALVPRAEHPYEVPENWCWVRLGSINEYVSSSINPSLKPECPFELYSVPSLNSGSPEIVRGSEIGSTKQLVDNGDVLLCKINPRINRVWKVASKGDYQAIASSEWIVIRSQAFLPDYLVLALSSPSFRKQLLSHVSGVGGSLMRAQPKFVKSYCVPLPPLAEQRRIAERVEGLFAKLDEVEEALNDVLRHSEQHVHVLLREAFSGELSQRWRKEHDIDFCSSWKRIQLTKALEGKPRNGFSPKPVNYKTEIKTLSLSAVTSGVFRPDCYKYVDIDVEADSHLWLEPGDILLQRSNSLDKVGTSALYTGTSHGFIYPDLMMKLRVNADIAFAPFVAYQLKTPGVMNYLREHATGTAGNMPKVNQATVCSIPLVLPCKEEQVFIANRLDKLIGTERKSFDIAASVLSQVKHIRSSVLQLGLAGKLGTNIAEEPNAKDSLLERFAGEVD